MLTMSDGSVTLQIWDTTGQEQYRALSPMYYRAAQVAIVCYDITNLQSLLPPRKTICIIVAPTKVDLANARTVPARAARDIAMSKGAAAYLECSAKSGQGIVEGFTKAAELIAACGISTSRAYAEDKPPQIEKADCCHAALAQRSVDSHE
jgi:small GTP-binding protein